MPRWRGARPLLAKHGAGLRQPGKADVGRMVDIGTVTWQNKTIPAGADFRGVLGMGLIAAWFYALWLLFTLPPFAGIESHLPVLLRAVLAKGAAMPAFGMIAAGFCTFHFCRSLRYEWDGAVARRLYLRLVLPLLAYGLLALLLFEAASLLGGHGLVRPWAAPLFATAFQVMVTIIIGAALLPLMVFWFWTAVVDVVMTLMILTWVYWGFDFSIGFHGVPWLGAPRYAVDFLSGAATCSLIFRNAEYLVIVRGHMILIGWIALIGGSILAGPALLYLGFVMVLVGTALSERTAFLPGEPLLLAWSHTALGIALVAPAVLLAWQGWGSQAGLPLWLVVIGLAVVIQILGSALFLVAEPPLRQFLRPSPA